MDATSIVHCSPISFTRKMNGNVPHLLFDVRIHYYYVGYDDDDADDDVMKSGENNFFCVGFLF
jgi:hypothetical protein